VASDRRVHFSIADQHRPHMTGLDVETFRREGFLVRTVLITSRLDAGIGSE
jgi:hypothetical protein